MAISRGVGVDRFFWLWRHHLFHFRAALPIDVQSRCLHACLLEVASYQVRIHPESDRGSKVRRARQDGLGRLSWPYVSHEPVRHFVVAFRAAGIDALTRILVHDDSPPRPPVLGCARLPRRDTSLIVPTDIGTEPHLRGKWQKVIVKFSASTGSVHHPFSHASTTPMLSHSISTTRPLVMHLLAARLALKCIAHASVNVPSSFTQLPR